MLQDMIGNGGVDPMKVFISLPVAPIVRAIALQQAAHVIGAVLCGAFMQHSLFLLVPKFLRWVSKFQLLENVQKWLFTTETNLSVSGPTANDVYKHGRQESVNIELMCHRKMYRWWTDNAIHVGKIQLYRMGTELTICALLQMFLSPVVPGLEANDVESSLSAYQMWILGRAFEAHWLQCMFHLPDVIACRGSSVYIPWSTCISLQGSLSISQATALHTIQALSEESLRILTTISTLGVHGGLLLCVFSSILRTFSITHGGRFIYNHPDAFKHILGVCRQERGKAYLSSLFSYLMTRSGAEVSRDSSGCITSR